MARGTPLGTHFSQEEVEYIERKSTENVISFYLDELIDIRAGLVCSGHTARKTLRKYGLITAIGRKPPRNQLTAKAINLMRIHYPELRNLLNT